MTTPVVMPQLGLEVNEGIVTAVLVEIGAEVRQDQPLMELETDKAITEVVAPCDGVVSTIEVEQGQTVAVGATLIKLAQTTDEALEPDPTDVPAGPSQQRRLRVAPVARRAAADLGLDLATITGTGPRGRITLNDVRGTTANGGTGRSPATVEPSVPPTASSERRTAEVGRRELTPTRRAIARRMTASQAIPQYHLVREIDATHLMAEKAAQASRGPAKVGINDLLVQAIAETAVRHPALATSYVDRGADEASSGEPAYLLTREDIDVGLAVATDRGLVVPVIRGAHTRGLAAIASDRQRLVALARSGRIGLEEMTGAVITLSSLAAAGVDHFTAMVNPGESTIVAVGRTVERLVPRGRTIAIVPTMTLTLTFDHRVVDGAVGADAFKELAELLEGGMAWRP